MADHTIEWYGPKRGKGSVEGVVSHEGGTRKAVRDKAKSMAREAHALLEVHKGTQYARSAHPRIKLQGAPPRKLDWYILLEADTLITREEGPTPFGPQRREASDAAAMGIEFGGGKSYNGKGLQGLHILGRVIASNVGRF